jgi:hypothetical protein
MEFDLEIVGVWSSQALRDFETHLSRIVAFKNDGTGWFADSSYGTGNLTYFEWSPASPGWVAIWETRSFELLRGGGHQEKESSSEILHLPFQVITEIAPNFDEIQMLRIEIWSFGENIFSLLEADSSKLQAPFFNT